MQAMKTIYLLYAVCCLGFSVIRIAEDRWTIYWSAHDKPQDGYGGHNGTWVEGAKTPQEAAWLLRNALKAKKPS